VSELSELITSSRNLSKSSVIKFSLWLTVRRYLISAGRENYILFSPLVSGALKILLRSFVVTQNNASVRNKFTMTQILTQASNLTVFRSDFSSAIESSLFQPSSTTTPTLPMMRLFDRRQPRFFDDDAALADGLDPVEFIKQVRKRKKKNKKKRKRQFFLVGSPWSFYNNSLSASLARSHLNDITL